MSVSLNRNVLASILESDLGDMAIPADIWVDESLDQIEMGEEPTISNWLINDPEAARAFQATIAAIHTIQIQEMEKGTGALEITKRIEVLVSRLLAAASHKAYAMGSTQSLNSLFEVKVR